MPHRSVRDASDLASASLGTRRLRKGAFHFHLGGYPRGRTGVGSSRASVAVGQCKFSTVPTVAASAGCRTCQLQEPALEALASLPRPLSREPLVFPSPKGGLINLDNWRRRHWKTALEEANVQHPPALPDATHVRHVGPLCRCRPLLGEQATRAQRHQDDPQTLRAVPAPGG